MYSLIGACNDGIAFADFCIDSPIATGPVTVFAKKADSSRYEYFHDYSFNMVPPPAAFLHNSTELAEVRIIQGGNLGMNIEHRTLNIEHRNVEFSLRSMLSVECSMLDVRIEVLD